MVSGIADELTEHFPGSNYTVKVVKNCPLGWSECTPALLPDNLRVEHRPDGCLVRHCGAKTSNAKVSEVHTQLPSLDIGFTFPINAVRRRALSGEFDGTHSSRVARRVFSSEKGSGTHSGSK